MKTFVIFGFLLIGTLWFTSSSSSSGSSSNGEKLFNNKGCAGCHSVTPTGPNLNGVTKRRSEQWIKDMIMKPDYMTQNDPIAKQLLEQYLVQMPNLGITQPEANDLYEFFLQRDKHE